MMGVNRNREMSKSDKFWMGFSIFFVLWSLFFLWYGGFDWLQILCLILQSCILFGIFTENKLYLKRKLTDYKTIIKYTYNRLVHKR